MPMAKYSGSPTGSGNPPGKHSESYLDNPGRNQTTFVTQSGYRGNMRVPVKSSKKYISSEPRKSMADVTSRSNKSMPYSEVGYGKKA